MPSLRTVIAVIAAVCCVSIEPVRSASGGRLFDVTTAHGVVANRPFQPTSIFAPDDTPIYVWYRAEGCVIGSVIKSSWFFLGTTPPVKFTEGAVIVDRDDDWGQFNFQLPPGRRWAAGDYRIELRVNDVLLSQVVFRVSTSVLSDIR